MLFGTSIKLYIPFTDQMTEIKHFSLRDFVELSLSPHLSMRLIMPDDSIQRKTMTHRWSDPVQNHMLVLP
jgi:hypothetical protein